MRESLNSPKAKSRRFRPYPKYKDSGVEWLGAIPEHWQGRSLKRVFSVINGSTPQSGIPQFWEGKIAWVTPEDLGELEGAEILDTQRHITEQGYRSCGTSLVPAGSLVLSTRAPIGYLGIASVALCTNQGCRSLVFRRQAERKYFYYELLTAKAELESLGQGSTFKELSRDTLEQVVIAEPPRDEQASIATFLDRETAKIDALIEKKERLIELLQEKRTALITQTVTKGLDPSVPMKDSGVEWLGEIPTHWEMKPLKALLTRNDSGVWGEDFDDEGVVVLRSTEQTVEGHWNIQDPARRCLSARAAAAARLACGDLVTTKSSGSQAHIGKTSIVDHEVAALSCCFSNFMQRLRVAAPHMPRFVWYFMNCWRQ